MPRTVGPFEILEPLGAGGMGEVFKARDTRLNRFVAIKFLPEGAGAAARDRFRREAQAIAALNHPHICTLYEVGETSGTRGEAALGPAPNNASQPYLVMELLEGQTLHARLSRGPVTPAQVVLWGAEIADALQAAHAKGILHRDLKPGNIFLTQRGDIKVLDFGLAQFALSAASDAASDPDAPTVASPGAAPLTSPGSTLGTYAYMSPEQARGEPTDARSDLFSLGVVLYETAAGRAPFQGRTSADISAAILIQVPPPPSSLRPEIPLRLDDIIAQCLEKSPDLRFQTAADLRASLRRLVGSLDGKSSAPSSAPASVLAPPPSALAPPPASAHAPAPRRVWLWPALALIVAAALGLGYWRWHARPAPVATDLQFRQLTFTGQLQDAAMSPDGKFLVHVDNNPQGTSLHLMSVANASDTQIVPPGAGCCQSPTFSPDGNMIYFTAVNQLKAVPVLGGEVRTIAASVCSGAAFSPDGQRIAAVAPVPGGSGLFLARADGTQPHLLSNPTPAGYNARCWIGGPLYPDAPAWSPDGRWIAVDRSGNGGDTSDRIILVAADTGKAQPFGPDIGIASSDMSWLPDGSGLVIALKRPSTAPSQIWELTYPGGKLIQLTHDLQGYDRVTVARQPDGSTALALVHSAPQSSVWVQSAPNAAFTELPGGGSNQDGSNGLDWTPAGDIVSVRMLGGRAQLLVEGPSLARQLPIPQLPELAAGPLAAPDGSFVFNAYGPSHAWSVYHTPADGGSLTDLLPGGYGVIPALLDGGRTVAFLYIPAATTKQNAWVVPTAGGPARQLWGGQIFTNFLLAMPDQKAILVLAEPSGGNDGVFTLVPADGGPVVPQKLAWFRTWRGDPTGPPYGVTPDGKSFVATVSHGSVDNLWAFPLDASAPYPLTHFTDLSILAFAYSHDGRGRLALSRGTPNRDAVLATGVAGGH